MKKNKVKRLLALSLAATLLMSACGNAETTENNQNETKATSGSSASSSESSEATSSSEVSEEPVVLTVLVTDEADMDKNLNTMYIEETFNVDLQFEIFPYAEGLATRYNLLLASEDMPDIILGGQLFPEQVVAGARAGALLPLNDYIVEGTNYQRVLDENPEWIDYVTSSDGNIYTFMETDCGKHMLAPQKMFYRADWLEKLGWSEPPSTPEEFKQYLIDIRDNDVNGNGDPDDEIPLAGCAASDVRNPIFYLINAFGLATSTGLGVTPGFVHITEDKEVVFEATQDYWREGLEYVADLYEEGLIAEETFVWDKATYSALVNKAGEEALIGVLPDFWQGGVVSNSEGDIGWDSYQPMAPLKGDYQQVPALLGDSQFKLMGAISADCEHPDKAFAVLDWMLSEEAAIHMLNGIEGINWEWVDEESYLGTKPARKTIKEVAEEYAELTTSWPTGRVPWCDFEDARYGKAYDAENRWDNTPILLAAAEMYEPYHVVNNIPQVVWADEATVVEKAEYSSLINDYVKTACAEFVLGIRDIKDDNDWEAYLAELDSMGLEEYIEVLYKYYGLK